MRNGRRKVMGSKRPDLSARNRLNRGEKHPFFGKKRPEHAEKLRGRKHSIKTRQKQSEGIKKAIAENPEGNIFIKDNPARWPKVKKILSERMKGDKNPAKRSEIRTKISEGKIGDRNPAWQGGISFEPYGIGFNGELKLFIRQRDNFICQFCGAVENGKAFGPHHINYNKKDNREKNLILLCVICNNKANADREKWELCFTILNEIEHPTYLIGGV